MRRAVNLLGHIPYSRPIVTFLSVANLLGSLYGFTWYRSQLAGTPLYLWPLVPDSPLSTLLFSLTLLGLLLGRRNRWLEGIAYVGITKYGAWSVMVIGHYWLTRGFGTFEMIHLSVSHTIMAAQGLFFAFHYYPGRKYMAAGVALAVINDVVDYGLGHHPTLFDAGQLAWARGSAIALTVVVSALLLARQHQGTEHTGLVPHPDAGGL